MKEIKQKNKLITILVSLLLLFIIVILIISSKINSLKQEISKLNNENVILYTKNEELQKGIDSLKTINLDLIEEINQDKEKIKKLEIREINVRKELKFVKGKYDKLTNDSLSSLVEKRLNPNNIPSDTILTTVFVLRSSLETQDSLSIYKKLDNINKTIINDQKNVISKDNILIDNQLNIINKLEQQKDNQKEIIFNKDKEIKLQKKINRLTKIKSFTSGAFTGTLITAALILLL